MCKTTINGVDYRDFPYNGEAEKNTSEIINYLNSAKHKDARDVIVIPIDAPFYITSGRHQPDTSNHTMD